MDRGNIMRRLMYVHQTMPLPLSWHLLIMGGLDVLVGNHLLRDVSPSQNRNGAGPCIQFLSFDASVYPLTKGYHRLFDNFVREIPSSLPNSRAKRKPFKRQSSNLSSITVPASVPRVPSSLHPVSSLLG